ncbi:protein tyrosine kinase domain-containing protein [Rhizoctonia solani AG-1 IA]|uniref:Protein tyrosine kinase domain-containing protein n=1 Tax=Thanatephorus cucumeris (strain AG1-IA) TaxID=983506 RepID=L8X801_THACA|nr:protein tyrosine kinase domain-containing protein [Rhizoctonia solani AG-1 IA]
MSIRWSVSSLVTNIVVSSNLMPSKASDVYALGTEVISRRLPYERQSEVAIVFLVTVRKELPERPEYLPMDHDDAEKLWKLLLRCWSEPEVRPTSAEVASEVRFFNICAGHPCLHSRQMKTIALENLPTPPPRPITPSLELMRRAYARGTCTNSVLDAVRVEEPGAAKGCLWVSAELPKTATARIEGLERQRKCLALGGLFEVVRWSHAQGVSRDQASEPRPSISCESSARQSPRSTCHHAIEIIRPPVSTFGFLTLKFRIADCAIHDSSIETISFTIYRTRRDHVAGEYPKPIPNTTKLSKHSYQLKVKRPDRIPFRERGLQFVGILNISIILQRAHTYPQMEYRFRNALDLLRGMNNFVQNNIEKSQDQLRLLGRDVRGDRTSWKMSRLAEYAIHSHMEDREAVAELCNKLGIDPQETEESFKVLVNNIRLVLVCPVQVSAAKLWVVMIYRCRPYFASHTHEQTLLETVEEVALGPRTSLVVRDRLVEAVGASVFLLKDAETLGPYRSTWTKLRQSLELTYPDEGIVIIDEDQIISAKSFIAPSAPSRSPSSGPSSHNSIDDSSSAGSKQDTGQVATDGSTDQENEQCLTRSPAMGNEPGPRTSGPVGDVKWLFEECESARGNCRILSESLLHTTLDSILKDPLIKVRHRNCFRESTMTSKEIIEAHIETATVSAGSARAKRSSNDSSNSATRSAEEQLLQALVTTQAEIKYTLQSYDELAELANSSSPVNTEDPPISRQMATQSGADVLLRLIDHGCKDLSDSADISSFGEYPISTGGFSDVYCGRMLDGTKVAMKLLRVSVHSLGQNPKHLKHAARELHTWSKCDHPNVAPLLGLLVFRGRMGMISPWMGKGSLSNFLAKTPEVDRQSLVRSCRPQLARIYLHDPPSSVYRSPNVLIADDGTAVLSDFGNAFLKDQTMKFTPTTSASGMSIRWSVSPLIAPEIINGERPSKASDVYALGTEVISGRLPYERQSDIAIIFVVTVRKALPERPECLLMGHNEAEKLWKLLLRCWSEQEARPTAAEVAREMKTIALDNLPTPPPRPISPSYEFPRRD